MFTFYAFVCNIQVFSGIFARVFTKKLVGWIYRAVRKTFAGLLEFVSDIEDTIGDTNCTASRFISPAVVGFLN